MAAMKGLRRGRKAATRRWGRGWIGVASAVLAFSIGAVATARDRPARPSAGKGRFVQLERTLCRGTCPGYRVSISETGQLSYYGHTCVAAPGNRHKQLDTNGIRRIQDAIVRSRVMESPMTFLGCMTTDSSTYIIEIWSGGKHAKVVADLDETARIKELLEAIEDADVRAWVGTPEPTGHFECKGDLLQGL